MPKWLGPKSKPIPRKNEEKATNLWFWRGLFVDSFAALPLDKLPKLPKLAGLGKKIGVHSSVNSSVDSQKVVTGFPASLRLSPIQAGKFEIQLLSYLWIPNFSSLETRIDHFRTDFLPTRSKSISSHFFRKTEVLAREALRLPLYQSRSNFQCRLSGLRESSSNPLVWKTKTHKKKQQFVGLKHTKKKNKQPFLLWTSTPEIITRTWPDVVSRVDSRPLGRSKHQQLRDWRHDWTTTKTSSPDLQHSTAFLDAACCRTSLLTLWRMSPILEVSEKGGVKRNFPKDVDRKPQNFLSKTSHCHGSLKYLLLTSPLFNISTQLGIFTCCGFEILSRVVSQRVVHQSSQDWTSKQRAPGRTRMHHHLIWFQEIWRFPALLAIWACSSGVLASGVNSKNRKYVDIFAGHLDSREATPLQQSNIMNSNLIAFRRVDDAAPYAQRNFKETKSFHKSRLTTYTA